MRRRGWPVCRAVGSGLELPTKRHELAASPMCRCEDDLTHKLTEILRINNTILRQEANGTPQHVINEHVNLLQ